MKNLSPAPPRAWFSQELRCRLRRAGIGLAAASLLAGLSPMVRGAETGVTNGGFESDLSDWDLKRDAGMAVIAPEAAHTGQAGLRITRLPTDKDGEIASLPNAVEPGAKCELTFWGKGNHGSGTVQVFLLFFDDEGHALRRKAPSAWVPGSATAWQSYTLSDTAPPAAAAVAVRVRCTPKQDISADLDDFQLRAAP